MTLSPTDANADEINMQLEDFAKLAQEEEFAKLAQEEDYGRMDKALPNQRRDI